MAEAQIPSLAEQYALPEKVENSDISKPVEAKEENPVNPTSDAKEVPASEESPGAAPTVAEEISEPVVVAAEVISEVTPAPAAEETTESNITVENSTEAATEESSKNAEDENSGDQETVEEAPEIKLETAPADFRFPTTNQTRHCFTRYIEYHRCIAAKGEDAPECNKFAKYYRSLCPAEWIERWNEQRENGTFPGPL